MNRIFYGMRLVLGIVFLVVGLSFFFPGVSLPPLSTRTPTFSPGLLHSLELLGGIALLVGYFVPLVLLLLAPLFINGVWFHLSRNSPGLPFLLALAFFYVLLLIHHRKQLRPLFSKQD